MNKNSLTSSLKTVAKSRFSFFHTNTQCLKKYEDLHLYLPLEKCKPEILVVGKKAKRLLIPAKIMF